jgi:formate hydrogenlyase subunit 3/multisubunit Na+/H+ antiporter MnhD subunit
MSEVILKTALVLIPLLPFMAAFWICIGFIFKFNRGEQGEKQTQYIVVGAMALSLILVFILDGYYLYKESFPTETIKLGRWLTSANMHVDISFVVDYKSIVMATVVALLNVLVARFSSNYLHRETGFQRFFMMLSVFSGAMMLIILGGNAILTFIGWELAGVSSYLLIAYSWNRDVAASNASRAFITNRIGDTGFILGIVFSLSWFGSADWIDMSFMVTSKIHIGLILFGFITAALVKSAQFPFSAWITRALEGPTPSSAIFYGSVMVHAGVYLLLRLEPLLIQVPALQIFVLILGFFTVLYAYLSGLVQSDVKSSYMFSTLVQVGLMFIWIGFSWFELTLAHIVVHAVWRAYQFLHAPSFMQQVDSTVKPVPRWLRKKKWLYTAALHRFWLDPLSDWLLTQPTQALAHEVQLFDEQVVDRITGIPSHSNMVRTLSHWEAKQLGKIKPQNFIGKGRGLFGRTLEGLASTSEWFEEKLILKSSGESLLKMIDFFGRHFETIDQLLMKPRYAVLLIMATFVLVL